MFFISDLAIFVHMAQRKEVFQSKVLQKLYPPPCKPEKKGSCPTSIEDSLVKQTHVVKRKTSGEDALQGREESTANQGRRLYTAPPPPPDYHIQPQESVTLLQLHGINSAEDPADEEKVQEHGEDSDEETEEEEPQKRRRQKKRRKATFLIESEKNGGALGSQRPADEGGERISRNKKRKLKKKRHKEKLLSLGLMPRAAAVEFTFQNDSDEDKKTQETEDNKRKAAEVSDFLRTTMEIYILDSSLHAGGVSQRSAVLDELLESLATGGQPDCVLRQLYHLKAFVQDCESDELEKALKDLSDSSVLPVDQTAAVVSLFQYWMTDIFPVQGNKNTKLSAAQP